MDEMENFGISSHIMVLISLLSEIWHLFCGNAIK